MGERQGCNRKLHPSLKGTLTMKTNKSAFIPAIIVVLACIGLLIYYLIAMKNGAHPAPPAGGMRPPGGGKEKFEPFKLLGTIALVCGAISFSWLRFKKKLTSSALPIKKLGKLLYVIHTYTGWAALIIIAVHGGYYLITKLNDDKIFTGLAAFLLLAALAGYGYMIGKVRNRNIRKVHFLLSFVWIVVLAFHAGGAFITTTVITLLLWGFIWILERYTQDKQSTSN
jgi:hypothetical protein